MPVNRSTIPFLRILSVGAAVLLSGLTTAGIPNGVDVRPLRAVLHDDVRVLWLGDSYTVPYAERVSGGSLLSWHLDRWTAFTMGDGPSWFFVWYEELNPSLGTIDTGNTYRIYDTGPDAPVQYALPLWRSREFYADTPDAEPIDLIRYRIRHWDVSVGFHGPFAEKGQAANIRQLFLEPPGSPAMLPGLSLTPQGGSPVWFDPRTSTRPKRLDGLNPEIDAPTTPADAQISASPFDLPLTADASGELIYTLSVDAPAAGEDGYVLPSGLTAYRTEGGQRLPGMHFSVLADGSWSYAGFGSDVPSGTDGFPSKVFSREQMAHWLDATTIDPTQPIVTFYLVNVEDIEPAEAALAMEAMVDQTAGAAADAGLGPVHHCIVIPWMHRISGAIIPGRHEEQRDAAFALAQARPDVSAVSIFDFTDGVTFSWHPEPRQWLTDHGYDNFTYGDITVDLAADGGGANGGLLDVFRSHPGSRDAAAFFAHVIEKIIIDACPGDIAAPYGVLDLADIQAFLSRFLAQSPSVDLAEPVGVFDLEDISMFVNSFTAGCP